MAAVRALPPVQGMLSCVGWLAAAARSGAAVPRVGWLTSSMWAPIWPGDRPVCPLPSSLTALLRAYQVDEIFKAAALAANSQRIPLAKMAVQGALQLWPHRCVPRHDTLTRAPYPP